MPELGNRIAKQLIRWRYVLLALGFLAALLSFAPSSRLGFDRSIEKMFARNDQRLQSYRMLTRTFGGNEIIMLVYRDDQLMAEGGAGIRRLHQLSDRVARVDGVAEVLSLAELNKMLLDIPKSIFGQAFGGSLRSNSGDGQTNLYPILSEQATSQKIKHLFEGYTHSADGKTASVLCILHPSSTSRPSREEIVADVRAQIRDLPDGFPQIMLAGEPVMIAEGFSLVEQDGVRLGWVSTSLMALAVIACFRSIRWMVIPVAVVQLTLLFTRAILAVSGIELNMVSSMFTAMVTVIGVATVVHVIVRFREQRLAGADRRSALTHAVSILAVPIFWACTTDAAGFASLLTAQVSPVRDFGVMMVAGSLGVLVGAALLIVPLALIPLPRALSLLDSEPQKALGENWLTRQLDLPLNWIKKNPRWVGVVVLLLTLTGTSGLYFVEVESDFTKNFRARSQIVQSYEFIESRLGGAGVWEVVIPAPEKLDYAFLQRVQNFQQRLRTEVTVDSTDGQSQPGLTSVLSLSDAVLQLSPIDLERVPLGRDPLVRAAIQYMRNQMPFLINALHAEDPQAPGQYYLRIMLRSQERQSSQRKREIIQQVDQLAEETFGSDDPANRPEVTGLFVLLTHLIESVLQDQWRTFSIATLLIGVLMLMAFRSPRLAAIALVPNILPIVCVMGILGWLGIKLNMGSAMIAAVSMGLSIDSSVHYILSFQRAMRQNGRVQLSLQQVQQRVGRAVFFSTLAFVIGFSTLCVSEFIPIVYFGALVGISLFGSLLGNLLILPLLLSLLIRDRPVGEQSDRLDSVTAAAHTESHSRQS